MSVPAPQWVFPSVNEYSLYDPRLEKDTDMDALVREIETVLGLDEPSPHLLRAADYISRDELSQYNRTKVDWAIGGGVSGFVFGAGAVVLLDITSMVWGVWTILGGALVGMLVGRKMGADVAEKNLLRYRAGKSPVLGAHDGHIGLWHRGNVVWPGVELEEALATLPKNWEYAIGGVVPPGPTLWEGSTEDLYSRIDFDRTFDESFDDATMRRTGMMRGGR